MKGQVSAPRMIPYLLGLGITLMIILLVNRDYPFIGHDYRYFIPRLIDTNLHIRLNGLRIQWYTPSFGGGLPAFPNPQHLEYSFVQWFSYFMDPWPAILLTTAAVSFIGYLYFYKFLNEKLELDWKSSTLGAIFFLGNGFYIEHLIVGQLGYQLFPLGAVLLYFLFDTKNNLFFNAIILALVMSLIIYQAGFYLIIILFLSVAVTLPVIYLYRPTLLPLKRFIEATSLSLPLCVLMTSAKLYAVFALMSHFPRQIFDSYDVGIFQAFLGLIAQLLGVMVLAPLLALGGQNTDLLSGALSNITGAVYGIWEIDTGLSPVLIVILLAGVAGFLARLRKTRIGKIESSRLRALFLLLLAVWIIMEWTFAKGLIYALIRDLPILRSLHVNVRFASAFILPLIIAGALLIHRFFAEHPTSRLFVIASFFAFASLTSYFFLSREIHSREFKLSANLESNETVVSAIIKIANVGDWDVFREHASSYRPYEPLFGYSLETFKPMIHIGGVFEESTGYFNMTNPVSLVFPEINNTYTFERIKTSERGKLEVLIQHGQPDWKIPKTQKILNIISLSTVVFSVGLILADLTLRADARRSIFLK
jgi:hypothetical protein